MKKIGLPVKMKEAFSGVNFLTPKIEGYYKSGKYIAELSTGKGMSGDKVFGCTVASTVTQKSIHSLSKLLHSMGEFNAYVESLVEKDVHTNN